MGLATWKAVLQEHQRCPFTKNPLSVEQVGAALLLWVLVSVIIFQLIAVIALHAHRTAPCTLSSWAGFLG